jgi:hypothetical protein
MARGFFRLCRDSTMRRCHNSVMPSVEPHEDPFAPPKNPKPGQNWVDEAGDLYTWDGTDWMPFEDILFFKPSELLKDP